jgi:hypothetical protein
MTPPIALTPPRWEKASVSSASGLRRGWCRNAACMLTAPHGTLIGLPASKGQGIGPTPISDRIKSSEPAQAVDCLSRSPPSVVDAPPNLDDPPHVVSRAPAWNVSVL